MLIFVSISVRRFEQFCKEVSIQTNIKKLTPSILRATAIKQLTSQVNIQHQAGLQSSLLYTHGIVSSEHHTTTTQPSLDNSTDKRKDNKNNFSQATKYVKSRIRHGGGGKDE